MKPLNRKAYGSIGHLPNSRLGPSDRSVPLGQAEICTKRVRDKHDRVIVQEKLDGSCTAVTRLKGELIALTRAGYLATSSPYEQHHLFAEWVARNAERFEFLNEGERLVGEWLAQAHGTRYPDIKEPWYVFDLMCGVRRTPYEEFRRRVSVSGLLVPECLGYFPMLVEDAMFWCSNYGLQSPDGVEGVVYRVERNGEVDFLAKYVRPDKVDGCFLPEKRGEETWNWQPTKHAPPLKTVKNGVNYEPSK